MCHIFLYSFKSVLAWTINTCAHFDISTLSNRIWLSDHLVPLFYEDPPILPISPHFFSNFVQPYFPVASNPYAHCFLLSCFFKWMGDYTTFYVLFYLMILWSIHDESWYLSIRRTLMCFFCNRASRLLRSDL